MYLACLQPSLAALLTFPSILGDNGKGGWFVDHTMAQAWPIGTDMAAVNGIHVELQGTPWGDTVGARSAQGQGLPVPTLVLHLPAASLLSPASPLWGLG